MIEFEHSLSVGLYWILLGAWRTLPLIGIVLLIDLLLRRRLAARFHCLLWALVVVRMLVPVSFPSSLSMHGPLEVVIGQALSSNDLSAKPDFEFDVFTFENQEGQSLTVPLLPEDASAAQRTEAEFWVAENNDAYSIATPAVSQNNSNVDLTSIIGYAVVATWFLVACGLLIRGVTAHLRFARRLRRCPQVTDQAIVDQVLRACDAVNSRRRPALKEVEGLCVPAVFGLWKPVICLPPGTTSEVSASELRWILMHEAAHIKRRDPLLLTVALFMRACHWMNPLAWLAVSRLRQYMEQSADEVAIDGTPDQPAVDYGRLLLRFADGNAEARQPATLGLLFVSTRNSLRQRIEMLDQIRRRNHWFAKVSAIAVVFVLAVTGLTDAKMTQPTRRVPIHLPEINVSYDSELIAQSSAGLQELEEERTYDVRNVLAKLGETVEDPEFFLTSFFADAPSVRLEDGQMTVKQTPYSQRCTKRLLDSWQRYGPFQITLECRVVVADLRMANDIDSAQNGVIPQSIGQGLSSMIDGAPGLAATDFPIDFPADSTGNLAIESRDESIRSRPAVAVKVSESQVRRLIHRCHKGERTSITRAPKITLFNGQHAMVQSEVQRPFVTGIRPQPQLDQMEPIIEVIHEGWRMLVHADVTENEGVNLQCVLTESELQEVGLANLPFRADDAPHANVTVQVPSVAPTSVRSSVRLAKDESLLIVSPATYDSADVNHVPMATFYLLTPRRYHDQTLAGANRGTSER